MKYLTFLLAALALAIALVTFYERWQQVVNPYWPLLALVEKWQRNASDAFLEGHDNRDNKSAGGRAIAYAMAAKDLEKWIKVGTLELDS